MLLDLKIEGGMNQEMCVISSRSEKGKEMHSLLETPERNQNLPTP